MDSTSTETNGVITKRTHKDRGTSSQYYLSGTGYVADRRKETVPVINDMRKRRHMDSTEGTLPIATKFDEGKTNWSLMPFEAIEEINKVLEFGAIKYDGWNFAKGHGMSYSRILNSLLRHIFSYMRGEDNDKESGLSHLAHAGCNIVFLIYYSKNKEMYNKDDRAKR